jgi:hypothetical protein
MIQERGGRQGEGGAALERGGGATQHTPQPSPVLLARLLPFASHIYSPFLYQADLKLGVEA